jgi:hypothetical protein
MAKNWAAVITIGLKDRASAGMQAIGGQVRGMSSGMTSSLGAPGRALDGLGSIATALVPQLGIPFQVLNVAAKAVLMPLKLLGNVAKSAFSLVIGGARAAGNWLKWFALAAAGASVMIAKAGLDAAAQMEGYFAKMKVAMKDANLAKSMMDWAKNFAATTPFEMSEVVDATVRLQLYGLEAKKWLPMVGDMAGAMGKSVTDGVEAVADAISGGGLERLKEFGISGVMLKSAGWSGGYKTAEDIETLKVALQSVMNSKFGGGMKSMMSTAAGAVSNFKDQLFALKVKIGEALMPTFRSLLDYGGKVVNWLIQTGVATRIGEGLGQAFQRLAALAVPALNWLLSFLNPKSLARVMGWFGGLGKAASGGAMWIQYLARYVAANLPVIGAWLKYLGAYAQYLAAQFWKHLPDVAQVVSDVFFGVAKTLLVAEVAFIGLKTGVLVVTDAIAMAFMGAGTVAMTILTGLIWTVGLLVKAMNVVSGGALSGWVKAMDGATKYMADTTKAMNLAAADLWKKMGTDAWEGRNASVAARAKGQELNQAQARNDAWLQGVRGKWSGIPEPVAPVMPAQPLQPWAATKGQPVMRGQVDITVTVQGADQQSIEALSRTEKFNQTIRQQIRRMVPSANLQ